MSKKELVQSVNRATSNMTDLRQIINSVFNAANVENDSFGSASMSKNVTNSLGSISGFKKVILFEDFHNFRGIAHPKSSKSKTIGSTKFKNLTRIFQAFNTSSMTALISAETIALLFS